MNKICVYTICKNEIKFIDRWYQSMKEADEIIVVDTGSTDGTVEKLKEYNNIKVFEKTWVPWRFDSARNFALEQASAEMNIFVSTDLDEILEPGWAEILKREWDGTIHSRAMYKYAWSHTESGDPARVMLYNKIHDRTWYWKYPVHETLVRNESCNYEEKQCLNLFDKIFLHHYPDYSKLRSSYLPLLELRVGEDTKDWYGLLYLAHEYFYQKKYKEGIDIIDTKILLNQSEYSKIELANIYYFRGCCNIELNRLSAAAADFNQGIFIDNEYRENYLKLAELYNSLERYHSAIGIVKDAIQFSKRKYSWLERDTSWNEEPYDILAISYYYIGEYKDSYINITKALIKNKNNSRLLKNKALIENKIE